MKHEQLVRRLVSAAGRLTDRVLLEMYRDPFWHERFGGRADQHGRQDGRFHIAYLVQALETDDAGVLEHYARWLQEVLTNRGMCTAHIAETFERLALAIADERWDDGDVAVRMLRASTDALRYPAGPARSAQDHLPAIVATALHELAARHPDVVAEPGSEDHTRWQRSMESMLSYAADALALGSPATLVSYLRWVAGSTAGRDIPGALLGETLARLEAAAAPVPALAGVLRDARLTLVLQG